VCSERSVKEGSSIYLYVQLGILEAHYTILEYFPVNTITISCIVYPVKSSPLNDLLSNPKIYIVMDDTISPTKCNIIYDPDRHTKYGGFKCAIFGHTSIPILDPSGRVCIKQCWYMDSSDELLTHYLYDSALQIKSLCCDINCS
jgi:hypothetical protein